VLNLFVCSLQVAPAELEALLCTHPSIQDAAVVGLQAGEDVGEVPRAFVVTKPGEKLEAEDVTLFVESKLFFVFFTYLYI
jgi:4-coumarate--CoA ligase